MTDEEWDSMIDINLKGPFIVTRRVVKYMMEKKTGVIINNSSVMGLRGGKRLSHYTASKWGLTGLTKVYCLSLSFLLFLSGNFSNSINENFRHIKQKIEYSKYKSKICRITQTACLTAKLFVYFILKYFE